MQDELMLSHQQTSEDAAYSVSTCVCGMNESGIHAAAYLPPPSS